jgi:hypothetical protein
MKASSLVQACENPWATVRMAQLCSVMRQLQPDGSRGQGEGARHGGRVERTLALEQVENGAARGG